MATTAALCGAMGSELLFEPWGPHAVLLPFLFFLVLVWSMTCGDLLALPFAAGVGSLVVQTHLSLRHHRAATRGVGDLGLVVALGVSAAERPTRGDRRRRARRYTAVGGAVLAVCWIQPLIEQFTGDGRGNITRLLDSARSPTDTIGFGFGTQVVATVVSLPPWWFPAVHERHLHLRLGCSLARGSILSPVRPGCGARVWCVERAPAPRPSVDVGSCDGSGCTGDRAGHRRARTGDGLREGDSAHVPLALAARRASSSSSSPRRSDASWRAAPSSRRTRWRSWACSPSPRWPSPLSTSRSPTRARAELVRVRDPCRPGPRQPHGIAGGSGPLLIDDLFQGLSPTRTEGSGRRAPDPGDPVRDRGCGARAASRSGAHYNGRNAKAALLLRTGDATLEAPPGSREVARSGRAPAPLISESCRGSRPRSRSTWRRGGSASTLAGKRRSSAALPSLAQVQGGGADLPHAVHVTRAGCDDPGALPRARQHGRSARAAAADLRHQWDQQTVALFVAPLRRQATNIASATATRP